MSTQARSKKKTSQTPATRWHIMQGPFSMKATLGKMKKETIIFGVLPVNARSDKVITAIMNEAVVTADCAGEFALKGNLLLLQKTEATHRNLPVIGRYMLNFQSIGKKRTYGYLEVNSKP